MNKEKLIKVLKVIIVIICIYLVVVIAVSLLSGNKEEPLEKADCLSKGKVCTEEQIFKGVEVDVAVTDKKTYRFNVISNDENQMTLIMNKNIIAQADWHLELINLKGPQTSLTDLYKKTANWTNVPVISDYTYEDSGRKNYEEMCLNGATDPTYDCDTTVHPTRGYKSLEIKNGQATLYFNLASIDGGPVSAKYTVEEENARTRFITREEITALTKDYQLPTWLIKNLDEKEGYWTLSSSTATKTFYSQGATAIANVNNKTSIESLYVMHDYEPNFKIGIRPVITIEKN